MPPEMAKASLSDADIDTLSSSILPAVLRDSNIVQNVIAQIKLTRSLPSGVERATQQLRAEDKISSEDAARLSFVVSLYSLGGHSVSLVESCFKSLSSQSLSLTSIIAWQTMVEYIGRVSAKDFSPQLQPVWETLSAALFTQEPTSFLCGLVRSGGIDSSGHNESIANVMSLLVTKFNINIAKEPIRSLVRLPSGEDDTGNIFIMAKTPQEERTAVRDFIFALQRLQAMISYPQDINGLFIAGFRSADDVTNRDTSKQKLIGTGIPSERATRIIDHANVIIVRNEDIWMEMLKRSKQAEPPRNQLFPTPSAAQPPPGATEINLTTMFGMENASCDDCTSSTGPAAYFVDLLQNLKKIELPGNQNRTLLGELLSRRPDLGKLQLSCANTNILIPYIDLVNEILESVVIWFHQGDQRDRIRAYNMGEHDSSDSNISEPKNFQPAIYREIVRQVYPLTNFPYNDGANSIRIYTKALGVSRFQLLAAFRTDYKDPSGKNSTEQWDRAIAAEVLGLQHEDYLLITQQPFSPIEDGYEFGEGVIGNLWGYSNDEEMCGKNGLTRIKDQFLPRSGLHFEDLLRILKLKHFDKRLVITSAPPQNDDQSMAFPVGGSLFTGHIQDMRLSQLGQNGTIVPLNVEICDELQRFVRLHRKLSWSIEELGVLTATLCGVRTTLFDSVLIKDLAAVKQLSELTGRSLTELQPLWGDINTYGLNPLYNRLFFRVLLEEADKEIKVFTPDPEGNLLQEGRSLVEYLDSVMRALNIPTAEFAHVKEAAKVTDQDRLSLDTISRLYRVFLLCRILELPPHKFSSTVSLLSPHSDPFGNPRLTLAFIQSARPPKSVPNRFTLEEQQFLIHGIPIESTFETVLQVTKAICTGIGPAGTDQKKNENKKAAQRQIILAALQPHFQQTDAATLVFALTEVVKVAFCQDVPNKKENDANCDILSGLDGLLRLGEEEERQRIGIEGLFTPPSTDRYTISCSTGMNESGLSLEGADLTFLGKGQWTTSRLIGGQHYKLSFIGKLTDLKWSAEQTGGTPSVHFTMDCFISQSQLLITAMILPNVMRITLLMTRLNLHVHELQFWQSIKEVDTNSITRAQLGGLEIYQLLRDEFSYGEGLEPLLSLYKWIWSAEKHTKCQLADKLASVTGWGKSVCEGFLAGKYATLDDGSLMGIFRHTTALFSMRDAIAFANKLDLSGLTMSDLFALAKPPNKPEELKDFNDAARLRCAIHSRFFPSPSSSNGPTVLSTANDQLRSDRRNTLIQYILSTSYATEKGLADPDSLFGHFLIDVQMGPDLQTSRIKQAISTMQLFIQRCLLDVEKNSGIPKALVQSASKIMNLDWEYILRYRLWEANRKVYLYPESWADPTLRDDKTEQFQAIESAIMQTKLDSDSIEKIVKGYLYAVNEVADLQVESYLVEGKDERNPMNKDVHLFGRTRHAPCIYYYRKLELRDISDNQACLWHPWTKIDIDVPVLRSEAETNKSAVVGSYFVPVVFRGRLFVFLPEIALGQRQSAKGKDLNFKDLANNDHKASELHPEQWWELRIGFTENRGGKWSPKNVSHSAIHIPQDKNNNLHDISRFQFPVRIIQSSTSSEILTISAFYPSGNAKVDSEVFGPFQLRGQQLVLIGEDSLPTTVINSQQKKDQNSALTCFSKIQGKITANSAERHKTEAGQVLFTPKNSTWELPIIPGYEVGESTHNWTLSFSEDSEAASFLVVDVADASNVQSWITWRTTDTLAYDTEEFSNLIAPGMIGEMGSKEGLSKVYESLSAIQTRHYNHAFGGRNSNMFSERATPFAIYNWELGVHLPMLLAERLVATQQYELALQVVRLVFDPSMIAQSAKKTYNTANGHCWSFPPFRSCGLKNEKNHIVEYIDSIRRFEWQDSKFNVHASARGQQFAYMKRIVVKYIEILIACGDDLFRQYTLESLPLAIQRYTEAIHVFGPPPLETSSLGKRSVKTYNQLMEEVKNGDPLDDSAVDIELDFPFYSDPQKRGTGSMQGLGPFGFIHTTYFCIPENPEFKALGQKINDRLYKIRHGMDINGNKVRLALFEPPIDPGAVLKANAGLGGPSIAGLLSGLETPMPKYRFSYLIQRAYDLANELRSCGQQLLSIKEKKDTEAISVLRSKHQRAVLSIMMRMKQNQKTEVERSMEVLQTTRKQQEMRLQYFLKLTGDKSAVPKQGETWDNIDQHIDAPSKDDSRMSAEETTEMNKANEAQGLSEKAGIIDTTAAGVAMVPVVSVNAEPMGIGVSISSGGNLISQGLLVASGILKGQGERALNDSINASRKNMLKRQLQERRLEANMTGQELMKTDKDMAQLQARMNTCDIEIESQRQEIENAAAEEEWLSTKYTNGQLYAFLDSSLSTLFHQTYLLACDMARMAQKALDFEQAVKAQGWSYSFKGVGSYWDNSRDGQLSGEALYLDLKRMEMMYMDSTTHDFEINKTISLRQIDPFALLTICQTGTAEFTVPEFLLDMDFPGHYCRRITSVAVSIPCIVGAYTSLNCTLSLLEHKYRISSTVSGEQDYQNEGKKQDSSSFRTDGIPINSIAVSNGTQDTGVFDLQFRGAERYGPFEGAGAISKWRLQLPTELRQFDYNTISDVVLHLRYTSFNNSALMETASQATMSKLKESKSSTLAIDLKNDYAIEWHQFTSGKSLPLRGLKERFPFWSRDKEIQINEVNMLISSKPDAGLSEAIIKNGGGQIPLNSEGANPLGQYHALHYVAPEGTNDAMISNDWVIQPIPSNAFQRGWLILSYRLK